MELKFKNITITLPDNLDKMTFGEFLLYSKEVEDFSSLDPESIDAQIKLFRICEILSGLEEGGLDDLLIEEATACISILTELINKPADFTPSEAFQIDDIWYATRQIKDMNSLTNGEYISLKTIQSQYEKDPLLYLPLVVAILVRPAVEEKDEETGKTSWKIEKFQTRDIDNLTYRANLFKEKALAKDLIPVINFFLSGKAVSTKHTETSSVEEQKQTKEEIPSQQQ